MATNRLKAYYYLAKPGIIRGNAITAIAGYFLAAGWQFNWQLFLAMLFGLSLIIASACVFNNYIDRDIDKLMERTKKRALVTNSISASSALIYGTLLGFIGALLLAVYTNTLTLLIALFGFFAYVVLYGYTKRHTVHGTVIGSISGAVPPVVGYSAVTNRLDTGALLLFLILVFWQMPHFYAIAIYRLKDYAAASIPVLPAVKSLRSTKFHIVLYILAFIAASVSLTLFNYTGMVYFIVTALLGLNWLRLSLQGFGAKNDELWARKVFQFSLVVITVLCIMIIINPLLP